MAFKAYRAQLKKIRAFTGETFTPAKGYAINRKPNFGQRMTVMRYFNKIEELTARPYMTYKPKRGEKTEVFGYTNQIGWRKFNIAIVPQFNPRAELVPVFDKSRPRGSHFMVVDKRPGSGQRMVIIPAKAFVNWNEGLDPDTDTSFYEAVIEQYAEDASFFLIQNGSNFMYGSGGQKRDIANKLKSLMNNYSATMFNPNDKNSHFIGNWFKGIYAFTNRYDAQPMMAKLKAARKQYLHERGIDNPNFDRIKTRFVKAMTDHNVYAVYLDGIFQYYDHIKHKQ